MAEPAKRIDDNDRAVILSIGSGETVVPRLRRAVEVHVLPLKGSAASGTVYEYRRTLALWEKLSSDPPVDAIDDRTVAEWGAKMEAEFEPATILKHWRNLRHFFRRLSRRGPGNPKGMRSTEYLIEDVPTYDPPAVVPGEPRYIPVEHVGAIYRACRVADWPKHRLVPAPVVWQGIVVLISTFGPRITETMGMGIEAVLESPRCPNPRVPIENPHGWLRYTPEKQKAKKPEPLDLPLTPELREALDALGGGRAKLFPVTGAKREWYRVWREILVDAGLIADVEDGSGPTFHDLRRTCSTNWDLVHEGLGDFVLGQAKRSVNATWYTSRVVHLVELLPAFRRRQPVEFQRAA